MHTVGVLFLASSAAGYVLLVTAAIIQHRRQTSLDAVELARRLQFLLTR